MPAILHDLSEHTESLVALLALAWGITGFLFYRLVNGMDKKIDLVAKCVMDLSKGCSDRRSTCDKNYVGKGEFTEWKVGRDGPGGLWHAINHHAHDDKGRVTKI
jgi:hypothetical protein